MERKPILAVELAVFFAVLPREMSNLESSSLRRQLVEAAMMVMVE